MRSLNLVGHWMRSLNLVGHWMRSLNLVGHWMRSHFCLLPIASCLLPQKMPYSLLPTPYSLLH
ncbi:MULTISPECIES: hypothetical protein [unclassified Moorena]|uniref:hypothetical protein n=1 Tax=unclassified Moorena TaxID=2683338 RepID=UPI0013FF7556|nr:MULTISPECIES: hypothetical protein [unclassified Moorena]NEO15032.1 hypothetical protein [Moorena sp. SIO3E8]NEQ01436.1 hypothetical protein [Moorena sp. SIO3F7]